MTKKETQNYIEYLNTLGSTPGLEIIGELLKRLGDPQKKLQFVHVAGTNGKGSVCSFMEAVLLERGLKVGRYLSPTIRDYRERISFGGRMISWRTLGRLFDRIKDCCEQMTQDGFRHPTSFEAETALAFLYFCEKKCEIVILECGMGGLEDATNIIENPALCVITSIGMDHSAFLGNTLPEIARQKAGIIKRDSTVVTARMEESVMEVLSQKAEEQHARLLVCSREELSEIRYGLKKQSFQMGKLKITISLAGAYQIENAQLALKALMALDERNHLNLTKEMLRRGMKKAVWQGRFQLLEGKPAVILDGAHNRPAAARLAESLKIYFPNQRIIYIMGVFQDKDVRGILEETAHLAKQIITFRLPDAARSMDALRLAEEAAAFNRNVTSADSLQEALELGRLLAGEQGVVVVFGSLSALGKVMELSETASGHITDKKDRKNGRSQ